MGIKKGNNKKVDSDIKKTEPKQRRLNFSFQFFDVSDVELCPATFPNGYTQSLMARLRDLSGWTVTEFLNARNNKSVRAHTHDWKQTSRPDGFPNLNDELKDNPGWQFCISANEGGRVHGFMIDSTFYIIWLDHNHKLYP